MFVALRLVIGLALLGINQAAGSTIFPTGVVYSNWTDESEEAKVCEIVLDVSNPPSREVVKFIALAGYNKFDGTVLAGFLMAAADITTADKYQIARISGAAFSSRTFNSLGHLDYEIYDDGTVMATTQDPLLATTFINAVIFGTYELRFARPDSNAEMRTYKIASAPGEPVTSNFTHCMDHLAIESHRIQLDASTKGSPLPEGVGSGLSITMDQGGQPIAHPRQGRTWAP
ncbi:hypothetical protein ASD99_04975 [Mesorhizobium sp. Root695]|uniref:hypothetical protein n=1 Tax=unclassified Mesorhizobium TaxID=325217 RepID=UPI0006F7F2EC|nr:MULTISPECIES: hypothetical protein [unclassified Mesorhizobium]KQU85700.1 hypothetical protein ASD12_31245 [Mesorhizobium sp. Root102]KRB28448.1 hypothetical protein ASD99_04975 [Mesorhizobium sp. Root695]